jgi:hypothetical protein
MDNFSKFLINREDLKMVFKSKKSSAGVYFIILLFLLAFFMLFPMWHIGYQGLILWVFWIILLIVLLIKQLITQKNIYLLTNIRLIYLKAISSTDYKALGFIRFLDIDKVYKHKNSVIIVSKNKKYYLSSIDFVDKLFDKLNSYIKH